MDQSRLPSRLLNEGSGYFGLDVMDLSAGAMIVVLVNTSTNGKQGALALLLGLLVLGSLVPLRKRCRRHIVRDGLRVLLSPNLIHSPSRLKRTDAK